MPAEQPEPLPRYQRPAERATPAAPRRAAIPPAGHEAAIAASDLSEGSKALLRGLMRLGRTATFRGGGVGLDYAGLLKTAVRPDIVGAHIAEAAAVLRQREVDLLLVPGMSGFPIGTMYAAAAGIPALLLRKEPVRADHVERTMPPGAFILPSYTGAGEVVMSADPAALLDITAPIFARQVEAAMGETVALRLRVAGADDIIDKATMARAASESARHLGRFAAEAFRRDRQAVDPRPVTVAVELVTWVTPLLKAYNQPEAQLAPLLETPPFAGLRITGIYTAPRAVGIEGVGVLAFEDAAEG
jgi:hypothetical protein